MSTAPVLHWLPENAGWRASARSFRGDRALTWSDAVQLANSRLDFLQTNVLDALLRRDLGDVPAELGSKPVRLAVLGSSTLAHLHAGIRIAALRRGLHLTAYENDYGQYRQELVARDGPLHAFRPNAVLFAFDAWSVTAGFHAGMTQAEADAALDRVQDDIVRCWELAREYFACPVLQQTVMPAFGPLVGSNEQRLPGSRAGVILRLNARLRELADKAAVHLVALDQRVAEDGLAAWHDLALWRRSKQEVSVAASPMYGELVARVLAALQGRSSKCLVLDLDNTLWGGVVGDDGVDGLILGEGSAAGESFLAVQHYAKELSRRGVILAVCSKNDEVNALEVFERHPEMALRRSDIACFVANWSDKAANLRAIAAQLNIGVESLVFLDDNPAERSLVRAELPMVAVPEVGDDPAFYPKAVMDAGYFESVEITDDDRERNQQYQGNRRRDEARASATDMPSFLRSLEMTLVWRPFDKAGLPRITQLINKTNQFNLTTQRYGEDDVRALMADSRVVTLQLRLLDRFGDNGIIGIVIGRLEGDTLALDTWLMSCRVLGRQVEDATLNLVVDRARDLGARFVRGAYVPTMKNGMVRRHYQNLGFAIEEQDSSGASLNILLLENYSARATAITLQRG